MPVGIETYWKQQEQEYAAQKEALKAAFRTNNLKKIRDAFFRMEVAASKMRAAHAEGTGGYAVWRVKEMSAGKLHTAAADLCNAKEMYG